MSVCLARWCGARLIPGDVDGALYTRAACKRKRNPAPGPPNLFILGFRQTLNVSRRGQRGNVLPTLARTSMQLARQARSIRGKPRRRGTRAKQSEATRQGNYVGEARWQGIKARQRGKQGNKATRQCNKARHQGKAARQGSKVRQNGQEIRVRVRVLDALCVPRSTQK